MTLRKNKRRAELSAELVLSHGVSLWFSSREEAAPEGQKLRPQTDWMPSSVSGGDQQDPLPPESLQHHHGPLAPRAPPLPAPREALQNHNTPVVLPRLPLSRLLQPLLLLDLDRKPLEPVKPVELVKPVESVKPVEPMEPVQPMELVTPMEPVKPVEPVKQMKPVEPVKPVEPSGPLIPAPGSTFGSEVDLSFV
uniref:Uncharacterized protein n=1 Tax=Xiphophorus couchianus TaxID=32473 RepID=A0A3B5MW27_9TELE